MRISCAMRVAPCAHLDARLGTWECMCGGDCAFWFACLSGWRTALCVVSLHVGASDARKRTCFVPHVRTTLGASGGGTLTRKPLEIERTTYPLKIPRQHHCRRNQKRTARSQTPEPRAFFLRRPGGGASWPAATYSRCGSVCGDSVTDVMRRAPACAPSTPADAHC